MAETATYRPRRLVSELDLPSTPVFLQTQQLRLEALSRYLLPGHGRLHVVRERVVKSRAEQIYRAGSHLEGKRGCWLWERDVGGGDDLRYFFR